MESYSSCITFHEGRRTYAGSFKLKVVIELLKGEKFLVELAQEYEIHPN